MKIIAQFINKQFKKEIRIIRKQTYSWQAIFIITFFSLSTYLLLEWIFYITKPSFFGSDSFTIKINTLLFSSSIAISMATVILCLLYMLEKLFRKNSQLFFKRIPLSVSDLVFSSLVLLLIDNFTYTVFDFGIVSTNASRIIYLIVFAFSVSISIYQFN
ncbi:MAG: hypothetical protein CVU42_03995 [Chloroflexi bacterium HGW-Chloroflexi-4]|jgi:hypothetical protein|nr:MAG: hypothetical protein CVU42_03995 [Chloroflexi bacterium HGW-Chloroflexi-4]